MMNVNNYLYNTNISELQEDYLGIIPDGYSELGDVSTIKDGIDTIVGELMSELGGGGGALGAFYLSLIGAALVLSFAAKITSPMKDAVNRGVSAALGAGIIMLLYPLVSGVVSSLFELGDYFAALAPILSGVLAIGGAENTALSASYLLSFTVWITGIISGGLLVPVVGAALGTSAVSLGLGGPATAISEGIKSFFSRSVALVGALLGGVFALQTFVSASVDGATLRAVRYAVSGLVPIVGTTVSGAMATIIGGLSGVSGIIGASSVAVIVMISIAPLVYLLLYRLAFALAAILTDMLGGEATKTVKAYAYPLDILISAYVMTTIIYIFEVVVVVLGGNMIIGGS